MGASGCSASPAWCSSAPRASPSRTGRSAATPPELERRLRPAAGEPEGLLVLFHGRGADEHDLCPLFDALDPERRLLGVSPRGPLSLPPGGAHWYALRQIGYPDPETFRSTYELV